MAPVRFGVEVSELVVFFCDIDEYIYRCGNLQTRVS